MLTLGSTFVQMVINTCLLKIFLNFYLNSANHLAGARISKITWNY